MFFGMGRNDVIAEALFALAAVAIRQRGRELSLTAASTLSTLDRTGPHRVTDLAVSEGVAQPSMTALVTQLERLGFAERRPAAGDRRVVLVALTPAGREYLRTSRRVGASLFTTLIDKLTDAEVAALRAAVPPIRRVLELAATDEAPGGGVTP
jgi:DNA-binding MarR family transcriptional regulator